MILHGVVPSPFTRKVVVVLEEKGMPYRRQDLSPFPKTAELLSKNPLGLIPILEHEGQFIADSSVICAYLERVQPEKPVYPAHPAEYAEVLFLEEYVDTRVMSAIAPIFRERFVKPNAMKLPSDESVVREAMANGLTETFEYLEQRIGQNGTLLNQFTVADAALGSVLSCLHLAGETVDKHRWPMLERYHASLLSRPSFRVALPAAGSQ